MSDFDYFKGAFVGVPGSGKTRLAYSASLIPNARPVLGLNLSGNPISIRDYPQDEIEIVNLEAATTATQMEDEVGLIGDFLDKNQPLDHKWAVKRGIKRPFKTIIFDSLTDLNRVALQEYSGVGGLPLGKLPHKAMKDSDVNTQQDHNLIYNFLAKFGRDLFSYKLNVMITMLETTYEGAVKIVLTGKAAESVLSFPYFVGRLTVWSRTDISTQKDVAKVTGLAEGRQLTENDNADVESVLQIRPTLKVPFVKNQYGRNSQSAGWLINPTLAKVFELCKLPLGE